MKVYIVKQEYWTETYGGDMVVRSCIDSVFTDEDKVKEYVKARNSKGGTFSSSYEYEEFETE